MAQGNELSRSYEGPKGNKPLMPPWHKDPGQADFVAGVIQQVRDDEEELARLRVFHNEVSAALANEGPHTIEHLLATASLGKHTTVIGRAAYRRLHDAQKALCDLRLLAETFACTVQLNSVLGQEKFVVVDVDGCVVARGNTIEEAAALAISEIEG